MTQVKTLPSEDTDGLCVTGGPGFEGPRPMDEEGWMKNACAKFRVFLLDQRGTGLSSPITTSGLLRRGDPTAQAEYLSHFRCPLCIGQPASLSLFWDLCWCLRTLLPPPLYFSLLPKQHRAGV